MENTITKPITKPIAIELEIRFKKITDLLLVLFKSDNSTIITFANGMIHIITNQIKDILVNKLKYSSIEADKYINDRVNQMLNHELYK